MLFLLFLIGLGIVNSIGFDKGEPMRLLAPYDAEGIHNSSSKLKFKGEPCGFENREDYEYLFFPELKTSDIFSKTICVKDCPDINETPVCKVNKFTTSCSTATYNTKGCI